MTPQGRLRAAFLAFADESDVHLNDGHEEYFSAGAEWAVRETMKFLLSDGWIGDHYSDNATVAILAHFGMDASTPAPQTKKEDDRGDAR